MATKDISDLQVVQAFAEMQRQIVAAKGMPILRFEYADDILAKMTNQCPKVCERAMERALRRKLIDYGTWLRGGWLTRKGVELLQGDENAQTR